MRERHFEPLLLWRVRFHSMQGNDTNVMRKGEAVLGAMNEAADVEVFYSCSLGQEWLSDSDDKESRNE
jgi:hypothetical protein